MHTGKILGLLVGILALLGSGAEVQAANTACEIVLRNVPGSGSSETLFATCQHKAVSATAGQFTVDNFGSTQRLTVAVNSGPSGTNAQIIGLNSAGAQICSKTASPGQSLFVNCTGAAFWRAIVNYAN